MSAWTMTRSHTLRTGFHYGQVEMEDQFLRIQRPLYQLRDAKVASVCDRVESFDGPQYCAQALRRDEFIARTIQISTWLLIFGPSRGS